MDSWLSLIYINSEDNKKCNNDIIFIELTGVTLVNKIIYVSGVQFYNASSGGHYAK